MFPCTGGVLNRSLPQPLRKNYAFVFRASAGAAARSSTATGSHTMPSTTGGGVRAGATPTPRAGPRSPAPAIGNVTGSLTARALDVSYRPETPADDGIVDELEFGVTGGPSADPRGLGALPTRSPSAGRGMNDVEQIDRAVLNAAKRHAAARQRRANRGVRATAPRSRTKPRGAVCAS